MMKTSDKSKSQPARLVELDSLRGLAAVAVLWFHYTVVVHRFVPDMESTAFVFRYGHFGVEFFFIISGFVIFMTLNRCRKPGDFVVSRFSRLFPTFWAAMTITFVVGYFCPLPGQNLAISQFLVNLTMMQEYVFVSNVDPVYWSLTYELGFYFAMFTLYMLGWLKRIELITAIWIAGVLLFHFFPHLIPHPLHYLLVINHYGHLFSAGILLYLMLMDRVTLPRLALLACVPLVQGIQEGVMPGILILLFIVLFWLAVNHQLAFLRHPSLVLLGIMSYALYLIHHMVGFKIIETAIHYDVETHTALLIAMCCSIVLAAMVTFFVEKPAQRLIRNRLKRRSSVGATPS